MNDQPNPIAYIIKTEHRSGIETYGLFPAGSPRQALRIAYAVPTANACVVICALAETPKEIMTALGRTLGEPLASFIHGYDALIPKSNRTPGQ